jgi:hypothetical protein
MAAGIPVCLVMAVLFRLDQVGKSLELADDGSSRRTEQVCVPDDTLFAGRERSLGRIRPMGWQTLRRVGSRQGWAR